MTPDVFQGPFIILRDVQTPLTVAVKNVARFGFNVAAGDTGVLVPVFTGDMFAASFLASLGEQGKCIRPFVLNGAEDLEQLLVDLKRDGVTHVNINAERNDPNPIPIDEFVASLRNRPK